MKRAFARSNHSLAALYEFAEEILSAAGVAAAARFAVHLAIEELFVNMVKYRDPAAGEIDVEVSVDAGRTTVVLTEYCVSEFDVTKTPPADTSTALMDRRPGGLGLSLVRNLVDSFDYRYTEAESSVIFTKESEA